MLIIFIFHNQIFVMNFSVCQKVGKTVAALRQLMATTPEKKQLIEKVDDVEMQVCLKKIPQKETTLKL